MKNLSLYILSIIILLACNPKTNTENSSGLFDYYDWASPIDTEAGKLLNTYTPFTLTTDLSQLDEQSKEMISLLIEASVIMDDLFWFDAYGERESLLASVSDKALKAYCIVNYGPWDRLDGDRAFIDNIGVKPAGANFYPEDMTKEEFEAAELEDKASLYTYLRRDESGALFTIPYHQMHQKKLQQAADLLLKAAQLATDDGLRKYLELRADALVTDNYQESDMAWLDMKTNQIDLVIGPIETYEDQLFGYKAAHTAYVLVKDMDWSRRLARYADFLPELQRGLPVPDIYKREMPGTDTELNAYDVIYYAGQSNAGSKTIAINLPNDEQVQLAKGTRRLQLKNSMKAKFDKILVPIADILISDDQRAHITFDAFFANTMFHEVSHGLGIKNTINDKGTVRTALKEHYSALEEGKADMLGLYMIRQLHQRGEIEGDLKDYYVTFMASVFRSVRFGAASAHGKANMIRFNYFADKAAFSRDAETGKYRINFDNFEAAMDELSELILTLQGDGNYSGVSKLVEEKALIGAELQADLDRLASAGIPVDVVFKQGIDVLGLLKG